MKERKVNILLITEKFPYSSTEQFLETEINYYKYCDLTILPQFMAKQCRGLESHIKVDNFLIDFPNMNTKYKIYYVFKSLFSKYFIEEYRRNNIYSIGKLKIFLASTIKYYYYYDCFNNYFANKDNLDKTIVYTYWNTEVTYALQSLKIKYKYKLISRIHGYDIYKNRRKYNYMPLKKQFTKNIDKIFTITESANSYLYKTYNFDYSILELSRLGVEDYSIVTKANEESVFHIVSCSYLVEIKQVNKIIKALASIAHSKPDISYKWTHIGNGPLLNELVLLSNHLLKKFTNLQYTFLGHLDNTDVYDFYRNNYIDVFINVSLSEGVPVSIMEAMSCHIPIIAPDIGGISDMIASNKSGILLSSQPSIKEISEALQKNHFFKNNKIRNHSYNIFLDKYNAKNNYTVFTKKITNLIKRS